MAFNRTLGYRLAFPRRLYGLLFDWRLKTHVPPSASIVLAQSATAKRLTYVVTATALNGSSLTYSVDPGDSSGLLTTSTGGRTFATGGAKTFTATVTDSHGGHTIVSATAQADAIPTAISLSSSVIAENAGSNAVVGTLSNTDANTGDTYVYTLVAGTGDTDNALFNISGTSLRATSSLNFETNPTWSVRIRVTDQNLLTFDAIKTGTVTNVNEAPTDIALSAATIAENAGTNATVGTLSTTDVDAGDTFTYTLVTGTGSTNNALFNISGSTLRASSSLNFESTPSCSVRVRSTDAGGLYFEKAFTITVTNVNEAPTDIALSASTFVHTDIEGVTVGTLSTTDVDAGDTFTYTLVTGTGDTDNASFTISGASLKLGAAAPLSAGPYTVRVRSTDAGSLYFEKAFALTST